MNLDPVADVYADNSPYNYALNSPVQYFDPDGNFVISAEFAKKYPKITKYLRNNIKSDVLSSDVIMAALSDVTNGNLNEEAISLALTDGSGPNITSVELPGSFEGGANGYYDDQTKTIELNEKRLEAVEKALAGDASSEEKEGALLSLYMLVLHETAHYGDWLDGSFQGGENGNELEKIVWFTDEDGNWIIFDGEVEKFDKATEKDILDKKKDKGVTPTLPEYPGSAGSADGEKDKKKKNED